MADDQYRTSSTGGVDWLNKWGLFTKLSSLLDKKRYDLVRALLVPVMQTLKMEPIVSVALLTPVVLKVLFFFFFFVSFILPSASFLGGKCCINVYLVAPDTRSHCH